MAHSDVTPKPTSDSEDDGDYVPPTGENESLSDEEGPEAKRPRQSYPEEPQLTEAEKQRARDDLWSTFQSSLAEKPKEPENPKPIVKIEKRYKFAGEDVTEVVEVPEDSEDAKKWPRWNPEDAASSSAQPTPPAVNKPPKPPASRPGPRKSKITIGALPSSSQKAKKLTTLDKSAMDWKSHLTSTDAGVRDELEANRRGGGYIEKMEFLDRVEERKASAIDANAGTKRRRG